MLQAIITILIFLFIILFSLQNMHQTRVNFPFAGGFEVTTIFLLILCFFLGFAASTFFWLGKKVKDKRKH